MARAFKMLGAQLGKETTPGTGVAANKKLGGLSIVIGPESNGEAIMPQGYKVATGFDLAEQWVTGDVGGFATFDEIIYILASTVDNAPDITTPGGGSTSRDWVFNLTPAAAQDPQTYSLEWGDATSAYKSVYAAFNALKMEIVGRKNEFSAGLIARHWQRAQSLTGSPTVLPRKPVLGKNWKVYMDDTWATLGNTQQTAIYKAGLGIGDRHDPVFPINASLTSFNELVEKDDQDFSNSLQIGLGANSDTLESTFESGAMKFIRLKNEGSIIEGAIPYLLQIDMAVLLTKVNPPESFNGVAVGAFDYAIAADPTSGNALSIKVTNTQTAL